MACKKLTLATLALSISTAAGTGTGTPGTHTLDITMLNAIAVAVACFALFVAVGVLIMLVIQEVMWLYYDAKEWKAEAKAEAKEDDLAKVVVDDDKDTEATWAFLGLLGPLGPSRMAKWEMARQRDGRIQDNELEEIIIE